MVSTSLGREGGSRRHRGTWTASVLRPSPTLAFDAFLPPSPAPFAAVTEPVPPREREHVLGRQNFGQGYGPCLLSHQLQLCERQGFATDVANRHLGLLGYFSQIPRPGSQIPRADVLPVLAFFAYAICGFDRNHDFRPNDGVVSTASMDGPDGGRISHARGRFAARLHRNGPANVKGIYWNFGSNSNDRPCRPNRHTERRRLCGSSQW
ncbi:hypothetical protein N656DRAFT_510897 [Canariomyces notabilis]|uniref:Uncharacterized protein n=1 Tax=Canariomyces notabilis TaxID=2074819 RepID=A0AAN6T819_9PEZI|nr:hypothetical protein N656DRAFT_510897 [Canariomyces arenarius]